LALAKAGFTLGIRPVSSLRPHEETIPEHVEKIASEMMKDGVQKDPIIIDSESVTVLDGMHRLAAFAALRVENAVCCTVDYSSKAITVGRWARVYSVSRGDSFEQFLGPAGMTRRTTLAEAFQALESRDVGMAVLTTRAAFLPQDKLDLGMAFGTVIAFDRLAATKGYPRSFVPEDDIDLPLQAERNMVVLVRRLGKDDVVSAAQTGRLFPCKTSMHRIDPRPVGVNFPINQLGGATTTRLRDHLAGHGEQLLPAYSIYEGRRYKERLLLLSQR
jgi:hypothetical protein